MDPTHFAVIEKSTPTAAYNGDHSLKTYNSATFTYDYEGNIKTRTSACGLTTYTWNIKNQLTQMKI